MNDAYFMQQALTEARTAFEEGEIPIGAIVTVNDKIIARGRNMTERLKDPTAHAEMLALTSACHYLGGKYLQEATLFVTIEPCLMCAGALYWSKIGRIVWGAADVKNGYKHTTSDRSPFHPKTSLTSGILEAECAALMQDFFRERR